MDREAWHAAIHGVAKSRIWLSHWTELNRASFASEQMNGPQDHGEQKRWAVCWLLAPRCPVGLSLNVPPADLTPSLPSRPFWKLWAEQQCSLPFSFPKLSIPVVPGCLLTPHISGCETLQILPPTDLGPLRPLVQADCRCHHWRAPISSWLTAAGSRPASVHWPLLYWPVL